MKKEWLEDYSAKEKEANIRLQKQKSTNPLGVDERYSKVKEPASLLFPGHVWAQIPIYQTALFGLYPFDDVSSFLTENHLSNKNDIDHLLELSRWGRIQFYLTSDPLSFRKCDYLSEILEEIKPPYPHLTPSLGIDGLYERDLVEFSTVAATRFLPYMRTQLVGMPENLVRKILDNDAAIYSEMKQYGYSDIAEKVLDLVIDDPYAANAVLFIFNFLIKGHPSYQRFEPYPGLTINMDQNQMAGAYELAQRYKISPERSGNSEIPYEIGRFVVRKATNLPESYESCLAMMDRYKQEDLYNVVSALKEGCLENDGYSVATKSTEMQRILEKVWNETSKIDRKARLIDAGYMLGMCAIGAITLPTGIGGAGFLASFGLKVADKFWGRSVAEEIAKATSSSYLVAIHDFSKKIPE